VWSLFKASRLVSPHSSVYDKNWYCRSYSICKQKKILAKNHAKPGNFLKLHARCRRSRRISRPISIFKLMCPYHEIFNSSNHIWVANPYSKIFKCMVAYSELHALAKFSCTVFLAFFRQPWFSRVPENYSFMGYHNRDW